MGEGRTVSFPDFHTLFRVWREEETHTLAFPVNKTTHDFEIHNSLFSRSVMAEFDFLFFLSEKV